MAKNVGQFLTEKIDDYKRKKDERIKIIISHNRVLEVEKIDQKEIKDGGKISENEKYIILDKDYGKSAELMRSLLEKKKKMPFGVFILLIIGGAIMSIIILIITYKIIMSAITPTAPITENKQVTNNIPLVVNPIKENEVTQAKEIKSTEIEEKEFEIMQNTAEFEKLQNDYSDLQVAYNLELKKTCESKEIIKEVPKEIFIEKELTEKEKFIMDLGNSILSKCNNLIINNINDSETETCKNLYSKYILTIK